jgi:uncharacterized protein YjbI with pentapeptide repeats
MPVYQVSLVNSAFVTVHLNWQTQFDYAQIELDNSATIETADLSSAELSSAELSYAEFSRGRIKKCRIKLDLL